MIFLSLNLSVSGSHRHSFWGAWIVPGFGFSMFSVWCLKAIEKTPQCLSGEEVNDGFIMSNDKLVVFGQKSQWSVYTHLLTKKKQKQKNTHKPQLFSFCILSRT